MYLIFASWCERFLLWRKFFFILSALFSYFVASLSFSLVCRSEKAPRPFCFFFDFLPFSYRHRGPDGSRKGPKSCCCSSWSHRLQKSKKGKNQDNSFFGLVFKAVINKSSRFRIARGKVPSRRKKPHTHTRVTTPKKNVFRSFLLCWHQSRRQDERPRLFLLEKSLLGASLRGKKIMVGSRCFFFHTKIASASARARVLEH